jgi:hypothetical protein
MHIQTVHTRVPAPAGDVFDYMADVRNLADWATEFIEEHELDGERLKAVTQMGRVEITIEANRDDGVVDIVVTPDGARPIVFPTRVIPLPDGTTAYGFTVVRRPDQSADDFESDLASLSRELRNVRAHFG